MLQMACLNLRSQRDVMTSGHCGTDLKSWGEGLRLLEGGCFFLCHFPAKMVPLMQHWGMSTNLIHVSPQFFCLESLFRPFASCLGKIGRGRGEKLVLRYLMHGLVCWA